MRLVQDLLFIETLDFVIALDDAHRFQQTARSWGEAAVEACAAVGIELTDWHTALFVPLPAVSVLMPINLCSVRLRSKAWRERTERFGTAPRTRPHYG